MLLTWIKSRRSVAYPVDSSQAYLSFAFLIELVDQALQRG